MATCCLFQPQETVQSHSNPTCRLGFNLIGHLMQLEGTKPLNTSALQQILESAWQPTSPWQIIPMGRSYYKLQFSCLDDQLRVASIPSWFVQHGLMDIEKWSPEFDPHKSRVTFVRWSPPPPSWIKINTDGAARGRPGNSACGGVFRDSRGSVLACFSKKLESGCAFEAELDGAITALEIARAQGWTQIWLEADSSEVVTMLCSRSRTFLGLGLGPCELQERWLRVLEFVEGITFEVTHIYREGNTVADALANPDGESGWWACATPAIVTFVRKDAMGCVYPRLRV